MQENGATIYSLAERRARREQARAYHPAVWTPQDAIDTANDFHAELAAAERGVAVDEVQR